MNICFFLTSLFRYHIKYMFVGDGVKAEVDQVIRKLRPALQLRLRYISHQHQGRDETHSSWRETDAVNSHSVRPVHATCRCRCTLIETVFCFYSSTSWFMHLYYYDGGKRVCSCSILASVVDNDGRDTVQLLQHVCILYCALLFCFCIRMKIEL